MTQWIKSGRDDSFEVATTSWPPADAASTVLLAFLADPLDRHHLLVLGGVEHDHAPGGAAGDADAFDAGADELAAVGHQHQLILVLDRERGDHAAGIAGHRHGDNAFAAAPGGAVFVGRAALAEPALREMPGYLPSAKGTGKLAHSLSKGADGGTGTNHHLRPHLGPGRSRAVAPRTGSYREDRRPGRLLVKRRRDIR